MSGEVSAKTDQQEIQALENFLEDKRDTQQRLQADMDDQAVVIEGLESELADRKGVSGA